MLSHKQVGLIALPLLLAAPLTRAATPEPDWSAIAQQDMKFAIDTIGKRHAGAVSGQLDVTAPLQAGTRSAQLEAAEVRTETDYRRLMMRFISSFGDPHTGIDLGIKVRAWNGIVIDQVNGEYRVIWSEPNWPQPLPPLHAKVQGCDNVWIGTYLKTSVAPLSSRSMEYAVAASLHARQSMFDYGFDWSPKQCSFVMPDGSLRQYDLVQRPIEGGIGEARLKEVQDQYAGKARPVGMELLGTGMHWVGMPNFNGAKSGAAYEKLYGELAQLKKSGWVIFDLRGNGGGNSSWGQRALAALYGQEYADLLAEMPAYGKALVADAATVEQFKGYVSKPEFSATKASSEQALARLEASIAKGEKMAVVSGTTAAEASALAARVRQHPGSLRVAAVINRGCFSSCMNFLQQIRAMGDAVVLGESTVGYSPYGEVNRFELPSGKGTLFIPSARYLTFQATREPFAPDLAYAGNMADDAALMKWVRTTLGRLKPGQVPTP